MCNGCKSPSGVFTGLAVALIPALCLFSRAAVPELEELVPDGVGYELIYKLNPLAYGTSGYVIDNGDSYSGTLRRIGYLLKLTDRQGGMTWVFVSMDPFSQDLNQVGVPNGGSGIVQTYVSNMDVTGNSPAVKNGTFAKGNIEFWPNNYGGTNSTGIPAATDDFDFGDVPSDPVNGYGSMQVHNYLEKQTVFAFNRLSSNKDCDLGIGNNTTKEGKLDWTFSGSGKNYGAAELLVVGKFEGLEIRKVVKADPEKISMTGETAQAFFAPGQEIAFTFTVKWGDQPLPEGPYAIKWTRTGDDGKSTDGTATVIPGKPAVITTTLDQPGFVRMQASLMDAKGRPVKKKDKQGKLAGVTFDGGAGVEPEKLRPAAAEPADFDAFWAKQKERLAAVAMRYDLQKASSPDAKVEVYAVSVDCAGPRPVTGYLTIPAGAADKSLRASAGYQGYGTGVQRPPSSGPQDEIHFEVNAHGYDLGKDDAYYEDFFAKIKSNGQIYAFDPKQNADPETAYFNGMALRVMRSLQFLESLPQWNGKDLTAAGGSQGGLQTIWAAGLDPRVSRANSSITWCCDFAGPNSGRLGGWRPAYVPALNYYDSVFHAKRITCPVLISRAGLGDYTCPPSGLAILYNSIPSAKKIIWFQGSTHGFVPADPQTFVVEEK